MIPQRVAGRNARRGEVSEFGKGARKMTGARPLEGLRVVDLSRLLPGPYATMVLADLGAEVIKVEDTGGGDYLRWMPPLAPAGAAGRSSWAFRALNGGKRGIALDLKRPEGAVALRALVATADVLVESFRPGVMERLGLGYETLAAERPELVYCAITGYGQDGPMAAAPGHDLNYVAMAGVLGMAGPTDGVPGPLPVQVADIGGSLWAVIGILAALEGRRKSGRGGFVDISMTEGAGAFLAAAWAGRLNGEAERAPRGGEVLTGGQACYGTYRCRDGGFVTVAALEAKFWRALCEGIAREDLVGRQFDPAVRAELEAVFATRDEAEWVALLGGGDACVEGVPGFEAWRRHPLTEARGVVVELDDGTRRLRTPVSPRERGGAGAPAHGEHTRAILAELGYGDAEIEALIAAKVAR
jgi:alpha-methylacyl-CoA racemase